jgi:hypothetical protein
MRFTPASISDVLEWIETFSASTGLASTTSALIHAELCHYPTATLLFLETSQRELILDSLEKNDEEAYEDKLNEQVCSFDEFLEDFDEDTYLERTDHYTEVLKHHGFTHTFIEAFLENLSPSSEGIPQRVEVDEIFEDSGFNESPVFVIVDECFHTDDDDDNEEMEAGLDVLRTAVDQMLGHERLRRAINPAGWVALMNKLGFDVAGYEISNHHIVGEPSFFIAEETYGHIPVFIVGASRNAYDTQDEAALIMKRMVQTIVRMNNGSKALIFYASPSIIVDKNGRLVFWGEVFWDGVWGEMILHQGTDSIDKIIADSKVVTLGLETFDRTPYLDKGLELMNHWKKNHVHQLR